MRHQQHDSIREMEIYDLLPATMQHALQQAPTGVNGTFALDLLRQSGDRATAALLAAYQRRFPGYEPLRPDLSRWMELGARQG